MEDLWLRCSTCSQPKRQRSCVYTRAWRGCSEAITAWPEVHGKLPPPKGSGRNPPGNAPRPPQPQWDLPAEGPNSGDFRAQAVPLMLKREGRVRLRRGRGPDEAPGPENSSARTACSHLSWPGWPEAIHCRSKKMCRVVLPRRSFQLSREKSCAQLPAVKAAPRCSKMPQ